MEEKLIYVVMWSDQALNDKNFWKRRNPKLVDRINTLVDNLQQTPYSGKGRPEQLKYKLSGVLSRRIDQKHRMTYSVDDQNMSIEILSCKGHYNKN